MHLIPVLQLVLELPVQAKRLSSPTVTRVPSIEEVVAAAGFTPAPSRSEIYRPGAVPACALAGVFFSRDRDSDGTAVRRRRGPPAPSQALPSAVHLHRED